MAQTDQIKKNMYILFNNEPHFITDAEFYSPGKGSAFTRVKIKNLNSGRVVPYTFKSGERVEELDVNFQSMQFLYADDSNAYFMDPGTYEQKSIPSSVVSQYLPFMKAGTDYVLIIHIDQLIAIKFPPQVVLEIIETSPATKGNTANNATKEATIETGHKVQVPLFIDVGDKVKIDPETSGYQGRA